MSLSPELARALAEAGQDHIISHAAGADPAQVEALEADLATIDLAGLSALREGVIEAPRGEIHPPPTVVKGADPQRDREAGEIGERLLREGRVAAFLVAGGQGTRLGHPGPKGTFPATPLARKPLFRLFAEKLLACGRRAGRPIPLFVMTSPENDAATRGFFEEHDHFGLDRDQISFLVQGTMPAVDDRGRLLLAGPDRLFRSPDGHGGSLLVMHKSGALDRMRAAGVELIFYFQVDNPLVEVCDPVFLGYHVQKGSEFSTKAVPKRDPGEKVGVLVRRGERVCVIEYSDLPEDLREAREPGGELKFRQGNIAVHVIDRAFVERLNAGGFSLPYHLARKAIPAWHPETGVKEVTGIKFETFVFDALLQAREALVMEVARAEEFSPIKNATGVDSPETSRRDQIALHASWLESAGCVVKRSAQGEPLHAVEISPLFADTREALIRRKEEVPGSVEEDLLLEEE